MVDHHVDRPGVEAVQAAQLTGTNRSIGLIPPPSRNAEANRHPKHFFSRSQKSEARSEKPEARKRAPGFWPSGFCPLVLFDLVVMARGQTPDPIPNSAVKGSSADGTVS